MRAHKNMTKLYKNHNIWWRQTFQEHLHLYFKLIQIITLKKNLMSANVTALTNYWTCSTKKSPNPCPIHFPLICIMASSKCIGQTFPVIHHYPFINQRHWCSGVAVLPLTPATWVQVLCPAYRQYGFMPNTEIHTYYDSQNWLQQVSKHTQTNMCW